MLRSRVFGRSSRTSEQIGVLNDYNGLADMMKQTCAYAWSLHCAPEKVGIRWSAIHISDWILRTASNVGGDTSAHVPLHVVGYFTGKLPTVLSLCL